MRRAVLLLVLLAAACCGFVGCYDLTPLPDYDAGPGDGDPGDGVPGDGDDGSEVGADAPAETPEDARGDSAAASDGGGG